MLFHLGAVGRGRERGGFNRGVKVCPVLVVCQRKQKRNSLWFTQQVDIFQTLLLLLFLFSLYVSPSPSTKSTVMFYQLDLFLLKSNPGWQPFRLSSVSRNPISGGTPWVSRSARPIPGGAPSELPSGEAPL